jgi:hypothetical protein
MTHFGTEAVPTSVKLPDSLKKLATTRRGADLWITGHCHFFLQP